MVSKVQIQPQNSVPDLMVIAVANPAHNGSASHRATHAPRWLRPVMYVMRLENDLAASFRTSVFTMFLQS